jgi:hypothetical protein
MSESCSTHEELRNVYKILIANPEGKIPIGRWEDNIKVDFRELGLDGVDWFRLALEWYRKRALVNTLMNYRVL